MDCDTDLQQHNMRPDLEVNAVQNIAVRWTSQIDVTLSLSSFGGVKRSSKFMSGVSTAVNVSPSPDTFSSSVLFTFSTLLV